MKKKDFQKNFACSVQNFMNIFKKIIKEIVDKDYSKNIVYSGGCALNSSANKFLTDKNSIFNNIFVNCAPGDNGGALGAAFVVAANYGLELSNTKSPYLGKKFNDEQIKEILENKI